VLDCVACFPKATISNGLSFNEKTGTISGMPIVASDSVTYTVTAVGRRGQDTATVVITVGVNNSP
jgi:hypothetical protein